MGGMGPPGISIAPPWLPAFFCIYIPQTLKRNCNAEQQSEYYYARLSTIGVPDAQNLEKNR